MSKPKPTRNEGGIEVTLCGRCGDWYPPDTEFFPVVRNGRAQGSCWACRREREAELREQRLAA
jgi:hypothetical protein